MHFALFLVLAASVGTASPAAPGRPPDRGAAMMTGAATPLIPSLCEREAPDRLRCAGFAGVDVHLHGPVNRRTLSLGGAAPAYPPLPFDASMDGTLRWHMDAGAPVAVIVGYRVLGDSDILSLVLRMPRGDGRPGCLTGLAMGARSGPVATLADAAVGFRCGVDPVRLDGPMPATLAAALRDYAAGASPPAPSRP